MFQNLFFPLHCRSPHHLLILKSAQEFCRLPHFIRHAKIRGSHNQVITLIHRKQEPSGRTLSYRRSHSRVISPSMESAITIPMGPMITSAFRHATSTAFSPVAA